MVKYCYWDSKNEIFHIRKRVRGRITNFGTYKTLEECRLAVKLFEESGWKKEDNWRIKYEVKKIL